MKSVSTIATLLLANGLIAAAMANVTDANVVDSTLLSANAETSSPAHEADRREDLERPKEQCSVSHQGRYRDGGFRSARVPYYEFDVLVSSNCRSTFMKCLVQYRTLVHEQTRAGSRTTGATGPWWESTRQTLTLRPGETIHTRPLGPTRRNAGEYEIDCAHVSRS